MRHQFFLLLALVTAAVPAFSAEPPPAGACYTGAYAMSDGSNLVVQPGNTGNLRYRFMSGVTGELFPVGAGRYESGDGWNVRQPVTLRVDFGSCDGRSIRFQHDKAPQLKGSKVALPTTPLIFKNGDVTLYGELVLPVTRNPRAVIVLQYGSGRESAVADNFVQHLLPLKDIAVFVFDKRGTGQSTGGFTADIKTLAADMTAAVQAVRAQSSVKYIPLGVMGESQGGWVAPLTATQTPVDFVIVSYGLAISMLEEDRQEVAQSLHAKGYGADVLAKGEEIHRVTSLVAVSRFKEGLEELERLKSTYGKEPWFAELGGDFTAPLTSTPKEQIPALRAMLNYPYDLAYDPMPTIAKITVPQLWILAGKDTEAPHETTLANLQQLRKEKGLPIEVVVFPNADHGIIEVEEGPNGRRRAGRTSAGYFELLIDRITRQHVQTENAAVR